MNRQQENDTNRYLARRRRQQQKDLHKNFRHDPELDGSEEEVLELTDEEGEEQDGGTFMEEIRADPTFFMTVILAATMEGMEALSKLSVQFFYKDDLHLTPAQSQLATGIQMIPWIVKPLWGFLSDAYPIFGYRRKYYLAFAGIFLSLLWVIMATVVNSFPSAIITLFLISCCVAVLSVISKALIVEKSQGRSQSYASWLLSLHFNFSVGTSIISNYAGGYLLEYISKRTIFGLVGIFPLLVAFLTPLLKEEKAAPTAFMDQVRKLYNVVVTPRQYGGGTLKLWQPMLFMLLWSGTPNSSAALFYFFTNELGFQPEFMGRLALVGGVFSMIGVMLYDAYLSKIGFRRVLAWGIVMVFFTSSSLLILVTRQNKEWGIPDQWFMMGDEALSDAVSTVGFFPILVLAARVCDKGVEGSLYALLMSSLNLGSVISNELGAMETHLFGIDATHFANLWKLILLNSILGLLPLPFLYYLLPGDEQPSDQGYYTRVEQQSDEEERDQ